MNKFAYCDEKPHYEMSRNNINCPANHGLIECHSPRKDENMADRVIMNHEEANDDRPLQAILQKKIYI